MRLNNVVSRVFNVALLLLLLVVIPVMFEIAHLLPYYLVVGIVSILMVRKIRNPKKSQKKFLHKWYLKRQRSIHVNGLRRGISFFLGTFMLTALMVPILRGTDLLRVFMNELWSIWLVVFVISMAMGYFEMVTNERRYEELIDKMEKSGEELPFLEADPDEQERVRLINSGGSESEQQS
ncbi:hypothetical protein [Salisediminibacterium beveridgei]|uniref:Uncharacterized protein n=1 Tax=Salisediminibacterium beveridgei TaxID=632773 RepID=A0A1D7R056_9BACI|nr:hypothetical protein [Salisediminibacterium beveridgei]AOM84644.1 hypothetical protein BBEV_3347 [Salisediminibacterium beveridgei]